MSLKVISRADRINESLIESLEDALARARVGEISGYSLVLCGDAVESYGHFESRLEMLGALQYALNKSANTDEPA